MKPVYMINGFLEAGKTEFIAYTLGQDYFRVHGTTLIIRCEQGEVEYTEPLLASAKAVVEDIDSLEAFTPEHLLEIEKRHRPERIVIEWNGMWDMRSCKLPKHWQVEQQITIVDGSTFPMYFTNMKSLLAEQIRYSDMITFNRCDTVRDSLAAYKRNVRALNPRIDVVFEDSNGEIDEIFEDDLPYDLTAPVIELDDYGFGVFYLDCIDHIERYEGKTMRFLAQVLKPDNFPDDYFVPGRMAMTCCAADMSFLGYACRYDEAADLVEEDWIEITAVLYREPFVDYEGAGPVFHALSVKPARAPRDKVISLAPPR